MEPRPDLVPAFPARRMIAVSVMFAGLIAPLLFGAFTVIRFGPEGALASLFLLGLASGLTALLVSLWKGRLWVWYLAIVPFVFFAGIGIAVTAAGLLDGSPDALRWGGALLSYGGCGLGALVSLRGKWWRRREWWPSRDALAAVDKPSAARALRELNRASRSSRNGGSVSSPGSLGPP